MVAKKTVKKAVSKPNVRLETIKEVESKINSLPIIDRIKLSRMVKNGKLNLNFIK